MPPGATRRRFTTADYHSMIEAGILGPADRVELLAGDIHEAAAIGSPHAGCVMRLTRWFAERVGERALVNVQNPVELSDLSEPEPDLTLLAPRDTYYSDRHPLPEEVLLLIEVAADSYPLDRTVKLPLYAEAGVREVWIVALAERAVEVFREPVEGTYREAEQVPPGGIVTPSAMPDLELPVAELFGA